MVCFYMILISIIVFVTALIFLLPQNKELMTLRSKSKPDFAVLVGDSLLNNMNYVPMAFSVPKQMQTKYKTQILAIDNATIMNTKTQLNQIKTDDQSICIFVSCGGNDLLKESEPLHTTIKSYNNLIHYIVKQFPNDKIVLLNLFYPPDPKYHRFYKIIDKWNSNIQQISNKFKCSILKVSDILTQPSDIIHDIEPSMIGGKKMVQQMITFMK